MGVQDTFADNMREFRVRAGLSQEALAEKSGVHRTYIGAIEQRRANISLKKVGNIAKALDIEPAVLFVDGAAARENTVNDYIDSVEELIDGSPKLGAGSYGLCEWDKDGKVRVEPIEVYSEDLTLRILCILISEGYGDNIDELLEAYANVEGPVLEFVRAFKERDIAYRQKQFLASCGLDAGDFGQVVGHPLDVDDDVPDGVVESVGISDSLAEGANDDFVSSGNASGDSRGKNDGAAAAKTAKMKTGPYLGAHALEAAVGGSPKASAATRASESENFKNYLSGIVKDAVAEYFAERDES